MPSASGSSTASSSLQHVSMLQTTMFVSEQLSTSSNSVMRATQRQAHYRAMCWDSTGQFLLACGTNRSPVLYSPHKSLVIKRYDTAVHGRDLHATVISGDNDQFATAGVDRFIALWSTATGAVIQRIKSGSDQAINAIAFSSEHSNNSGKSGSVLIAAGDDTFLRCYDLNQHNSSKPIQVLQEATDSINSIICSEHKIITASTDGCVRTYDIRNGRCLTDHILQPISSIALTRDGRCLLAAALDSTMRLMDISTGEMLNTYTATTHQQSQSKLQCCVSHDDAYVYCGSEHSSHGVNGWELAAADSSRSDVQLMDHSNTVNAIAHSPTERCLATAALDGTLKIWR